MALEYEVIEKIGVLSETKNTRTEVRLVAWNGEQPKLDVRVWIAPGTDEEKPGKGKTLSDLEAALLRDILVRMNLPSPTAEYLHIARARRAAGE
jgi:hypothetical protein